MNTNIIIHDGYVTLKFETDCTISLVGYTLEDYLSFYERLTMAADAARDMLDHPETYQQDTDDPEHETYDDES